MELLLDAHGTSAAPFLELGVVFFSGYKGIRGSPMPTTDATRLCWLRAEALRRPEV
jgi:hypothetical protein